VEDLTGRQFGPYQIVGPLGEGGMAAVYKAYHPATERYVALKVLPRQLAKDPQFVSRFQREAKLLAQLQHPHILPVFDYGQAEGYTYIVMPFVTGGTLADELQGEPLPLPKIRQITTQIAEALNYAHERGLIHRDIKPSNVLIDEGGNCLLTDFGLARMVESSVNLTTSGTVMGTPAYMSPEQGSGQKIDARTDIYSLGVILYQLATGRVPYQAETPVAVIFKHMNDPLPPPRAVNPQLPEAVELVILKALFKRVEDRFPSARAMAMAIRQAIPETPPTTTPPAITPRSWVPTVVTQAGTGAQGIEDEAQAARPGRRAWPILMLGSMGILGIALVGAVLVLLIGPLDLLPGLPQVAGPRPTNVPTQLPRLTPTVGLPLLAHATPTRPAPAPSPTLAPTPTETRMPSGSSIVGQVMWGSQPISGAGIELKASGDFYSATVLAQTVTATDGTFLLEDAPPGSHFIYAVAPSDEYWAWTGNPVNIVAGSRIDVGTFYLSKKLQLVEPTDNAVVGTTPTLGWSAFPGATKYHVDLFNDETGQAVLRKDTTETSLTVSPPLVPGVLYQWSVHAMNSAGITIAYYSAWRFTVQP